MKNKSARRQLIIRRTFILFQVASIVLPISFCEIYFRRTERYSSYFDRNGLTNVGHETEKLKEPWLWLNEKNSRRILREKEFRQENMTNAEGLVGDAPAVEKRSGELRIVAIGDSFTEGIGDLQENGYPDLLQNKLNKININKEFTVMNAGVSGSDPIFGIELLKRRLLKYKPDIVLFTINQSDIDDLVRRGGFDRFNEQGFLKTKKYPLWSWAFDNSHVVRAIVLGWLKYDWEFNSPTEAILKRQAAIKDLVECGIIISHLSREHSFKLLVLIHPFWRQIKNPEFYKELQEIAIGLEKAQVLHANLLPDFIAEIPGVITPEYYWPRDSHFTHKGYEIFANAVLKNMEEKNILAN